MNLNPLNQTSAALEHMIKSIDRQEFYTGLLTRSRIATIYDKYYPELISKLPVDEDQAIRTLLVYSLRYVNMSVQHIDVLLVNGLEYITRMDLDRPEREIAAKLVKENMEAYDLDTITRVVGQINNKLPMDLRERFYPRLKIAVIQKLYALLGMNVIEKSVSIEAFQDRLEEDTSTSTTKPSSLDNNYLDDLDKVLGKDTVAELKKTGYNLEDISRERIKMNINKGTYEDQLKEAIEAGNTEDKVTTDVLPINVLFAKYIDRTPQLHMDAKTKELYYFDEVSRSLIPMKDVEKINITGMSKRSLENTLKKYELPESDLEKLVYNPEKEEKKDKSKNKDDVVNSRLLTPEQKAWLATTTTKKATEGLWGINWDFFGYAWYYWAILAVVVLVLLLVAGYYGYKYYVGLKKPVNKSGNSNNTSNNVRSK